MKTAINPRNFVVVPIQPNLIIIEAVLDCHHWGNQTDTERAFIAYAGCTVKQARYLIELLREYGTQKSLVARPCKRLSGYQVELKIRGLRREDGFLPLRIGLEGLKAILERYI